jgi:hypothetical protein
VSVRQTWLSRQAIGLHAVIIVIVPTFAALCDWQVHRALSGNQLSWAYVFEWPFFGGYAIYMWWRILHEAPTDSTGPTGLTETTTDAPSHAVATPDTVTDTDADAEAEADADAEERDAYNRYLSELATRGRRKQWR